MRGGLDAARRVEPAIESWAEILNAGYSLVLKGVPGGYPVFALPRDIL